MRGYVKFLAYYTDNDDALQSATDVYLDDVAQKRAHNIPATKSFDAFRYWVVEQSGRYETFEMPDGSLRRVAKSISFARMDDLAFGELYKATLMCFGTSFYSVNFPPNKLLKMRRPSY